MIAQSQIRMQITFARVNEKDDGKEGERERLYFRRDTIA